MIFAFRSMPLFDRRVNEYEQRECEITKTKARTNEVSAGLKYPTTRACEQEVICPSNAAPDLAPLARPRNSLASSSLRSYSLPSLLRLRLCVYEEETSRTSFSPPIWLASSPRPRSDLRLRRWPSPIGRQFNADQRAPVDSPHVTMKSASRTRGGPKQPSTPGSRRARTRSERIHWRSQRTQEHPIGLLNTVQLQNALRRTDPASC